VVEGKTNVRVLRVCQLEPATAQASTQANIVKEYIVARVDTLINSFKTLLNVFDDLTNEFRVDVYQRMMQDGEIVGTGIEISADVQFTVRVLKKKVMEWPRGENRDFIWTVGNARPLDQCIQHATTEMMRWLQSDYKMSVRHASTLLGQCVKYDMGNIFDPAFTMVCRLAKKWLE